MPECSPPRRILGRRRRPVLLTDLPDELLLKIISCVLETSVPGQIAQRAIARFRHHGLVLALLSRRFNSLVRQSVTAIAAHTNSDQWARAMVVFARTSLQTLHVAAAPAPAPARRPSSTSLCMLIASVRPPLREISLPNLGVAPFEHVVAMLRALPLLRDIDLHRPRPMDVAAVARACHALTRLSLGTVSHARDVDAMRNQFVNLVCSPLAKTLRVLTISWSCATIDAFVKIAAHCTQLERFGAEFGAMYWIRHRAYKAQAPLHVDLSACAREQRDLLHAMLRAISRCDKLKSFAIRTIDRIPSVDLDQVFSSLEGFQDLDMLIGSTSKPIVFSNRSFDLLSASLSATLRRLNIVGVSFFADHVVELAKHFSKLTSLSIWMAENEGPPLCVFESLGKRIRHLSILCDWTEEMCEAVGKHNTCLESLSMAARELPLDAVTSVAHGVGSTLKKFRLYVNQEGAVVPADADDEYVREAAAVETAAKATMTSFVYDAARIVATECATNLEILSVSASGGDNWFVSCSDIYQELRKVAPHLWHICDLGAID